MTIDGGKPQDGPKKYKIMGIETIESNDEAGAADILKTLIHSKPWYKYLKLEEVQD
jgi:hypothetical protein